MAEGDVRVHSQPPARSSVCTGAAFRFVQIGQQTHTAFVEAAAFGSELELRVERLISRVPRRCSRREISLLTAEGVIVQARAAAEKLPSSMTRTNTSSSPERLISRRAMATF